MRLLWLLPALFIYYAIFLTPSKLLHGNFKPGFYIGTAFLAAYAVVGTMMFCISKAFGY